MDKQYRTIIGMETHIELKTASKMFCGCKNDPFYAPAPNIYTCPVCLGLPGALPVPNKKAVQWTLMLGLALGCKVNMLSKFDRKHYFYPDLPKGYQISQYDVPLCYDGKLQTSFGEVRIRRVHLEEDTGKLLHAKIDGQKVTLVDFNRSGVPLVEIVTEPDIHCAEQAKEYAKKLRQLVRYLDISDCDMEQGSMRLEANISLKQITSNLSLDTGEENELPSYKVELKNINSFRFLERAINYEIRRQAEILAKGEMPVQETRGYNPEKDITYTQRVKETAEDYRYFPDPDIPPMRFSDEQIQEIQGFIPELPFQVIARWQKTYGLEPRFAELIFERFYEVEKLDLIFAELIRQGLSVAKLVSLLAQKKIEVDILRDTPEQICVIFKKLTMLDDVSEKEIIPVVETVLKENFGAVEDYLSGRKQVINFLVGQVNKALGKKIDFSRLRSLVEEQIKKL